MKAPEFNKDGFLFHLLCNSSKNDSQLVERIVALLSSAANHILNRLTWPPAIIAISKPFKKIENQK